VAHLHRSFRRSCIAGKTNLEVTHRPRQTFSITIAILIPTGLASVYRLNRAAPQRHGTRWNAIAPIIAPVLMMFQAGAAARLFLALEQITVVAFDDRIRLLVHVSVQTE
jgi:hypothetical protein